ncbi:unnamed protein product, partial [Allacma fusca]
SYEKGEFGLEKVIEHSEFELTETEDVVTSGRQLRKRKTRKNTVIIEKATSIIGNGVPSTASNEPITATSTTLVREGTSGTPISFPADLEKVPHLELLVLPENNQSNVEFGVDATYTNLSTAFSQHSLQSGCGVTEILAAVNKLAIEQATAVRKQVEDTTPTTFECETIVKNGFLDLGTDTAEKSAGHPLIFKNTFYIHFY